MDIKKLISALIAFIFLTGAFAACDFSSLGEGATEYSNEGARTITIHVEIPEGIGGSFKNTDENSIDVVFENVGQWESVEVTEAPNLLKFTLPAAEGREEKTQVIDYAPKDGYKYVNCSSSLRFLDYSIEPVFHIGYCECTIQINFVNTNSPDFNVLRDEIDKCEKSGVKKIVLENDYCYTEISKAAILPDGFTLDMNGHEIWCKTVEMNPSAIFNVKGAVTVTGNGLFFGNKVVEGNGNQMRSLFSLDPGSSLNLESGTMLSFTSYIDENNNGVIDVNSNGGISSSVTMGEEFTIASCGSSIESGRFGYIICGVVDLAAGCTFTMNGGTVTGVCAGCFVSSDGGTTNLNGGTIKEFYNLAGDLQVLYLKNNSMLNMTKIAISSSSMGILFKLIDSKAEFSGGEIKEIETTSGVINSENSIITITKDFTIADVQSAEKVLIFDEYDSEIIVSGGYILGNKDNISIYVMTGNVKISGNPHFDCPIAGSADNIILNDKLETIVEISGSAGEGAQFATINDNGECPYNLVNTNHNLCGEISSQNSNKIVWTPCALISVLINKIEGSVNTDGIVFPHFSPENPNKIMIKGNEITSADGYGTITATAKDGFKFVKWVDENEVELTGEMPVYPGMKLIPVFEENSGSEFHTDSPFLPIIIGFVIVALLAIAICSKYGNKR